MRHYILLFICILFSVMPSWAEDHFLLAAFNQILEINREGKVLKSHQLPDHFGIYEAWKLPNGHIVFSHRKGLTMIDKENQVVMNHKVKLEAVSCDVLAGGKSFALMDNSVPSIKEIDLNGKLIQETPLPNLTQKAHGRYRSIRKAKDENAYWACQLSSSKLIKVEEKTGKILAELPLKQYKAIHLFGVTDLGNDGILASIGKGELKYVFHCDRDLNIIKKFNSEELGIDCRYFLGTQKLENGNILLACGDYHLKELEKGKDLLVEITPNNKVVWRLTRDQLVNQIDGFVDKKTSIEEMRITNVHLYNSSMIEKSLAVVK